MRIAVITCVVLLLAGAAYADVYDLALSGVADARLIGPETEANLGYSVAVGDFDGDGIDDLAMGAPGVGNTLPTYRRGAVYLMLSTAGYLEADIDLDQDYAHVRILGQVEQYTGTSVAAGDLNGDGIDDLAIGAPRADGPGAEAVLGVVYVFYGSTAWEATLSTADADVTIWGEKADSQFGSRLAIDDFDGDDIDDLFVSAPGYEDVGLPAAGKVYGFLGGQLPVLIDLRPVTAEADVEVSGGLDNQRLGVGLALGDLDGDGLADLALGAPGLSQPLPGSKESNDGTVYLVLGRELSDTFRLDLATQTADSRIEWANQKANLGYSLATGDFDGDGIADLALGAPNMPAKSGGGEVFLLYGRTEWASVIDLFTSDIIVHGASTGDRFGFALAFGDADGDCVEDLYIGAPRYFAAGNGHVYVIAGGFDYPLQYEIDLSGADDPLHDVVGPADGDELGFALATGDFDADGVTDLLVGARGLDVGDPARLQGGGAFALLSRDDNQPPIARAGPDMQATIDELVILDGSKSVDLEGGLLSYEWSMVGGPDGATLSDADTSQAKLIPRNVGEYVFQLVVYDCLQASEPDEMIVTVTDEPLDDDDGDDDDDDGDDDNGGKADDDDDGVLGYSDDNSGVYGGGGCSG